jgi:hypothetical protein
VLAVDEEAAASILADAGLEISEARYLELKKKVMERTAPGFVPSQKPPALPPQPLVGNAVPAVGTTGSTFEAVKAEGAGGGAVGGAGEVEATGGEGVVLMTTSKAPPVDPLLDTQPKKRRKSSS